MPNASTLDISAIPAAQRAAVLALMDEVTALNHAKQVISRFGRCFTVVSETLL